jgi:hypothetical protein
MNSIWKYTPLPEINDDHILLINHLESGEVFKFIPSNAIYTGVRKACWRMLIAYYPDETYQRPYDMWYIYLPGESIEFGWRILDCSSQTL